MKKDYTPSSVRIQLRDCRVCNEHILGSIEPLVTGVEWRPLAGLRNTTLIGLCCGFEHIDFWGRPANECAIAVFGPGVCLTGTGATGESLTRKVGEVTQVILVTWISRNIWYPFPRLVWNGPDITRIIGIRPLQKDHRSGSVRRYRPRAIGIRTIPSKLAP